MTEQEKQDLETLHAEQNKIRERAFWSMRDALRYDATMLKVCGAKSNEECLMHRFKYALDELDRLLKAHLKKYPD